MSKTLGCTILPFTERDVDKTLVQNHQFNWHQNIPSSDNLEGSDHHA